MKKLYKLILLVFLFSSCHKIQEKSNSSEIHSDAAYQNSVFIEGKRLNISDQLNTPKDLQLATINNELFAIVTDISYNPPIHLVNVTKDEYIHSLSRSGQGPGEFTQISAITFHENEFTVIDPANSRLTSIPVDVFTDPTMRDHKNFSLRDFEYSGLAMDIIPVDKDRFIIIGPIRTLENKRFTLFDLDNQSREHFGIHTQFDEKKGPNINQLLNRERSTFSHKRSSFVTSKYHKDRVDFFTFEGEKITTFKGPKYNALTFKPEGDRYVLDDRNIISFIDLDSNDDYIYLLYSGKSIIERNRNYGDYVIVLNWNGEFVQSFKLDFPAIALAVNDDGSMILTSTHEDEPGLLVYNLTLH